MLFNYLRLSFRLLVRHPFFTVVNIVGLGIGFASFFALWSYSVRELKSNQYHKNYERIARIGTHWRTTDDGGKNWNYNTFGFTKSDLPARFKDDFPEVEDYTRILPQRFFSRDIVPHGRQITISVEGFSTEQRLFKEDKVIYSDENLFKMFSFPLIYGDADHALIEAGSAVLSERLAKKYFADANPLDESLILNDSIALKVTGVFKDLPHYTHFDFDLVISNKAYLSSWATAFFGATQCFVKLRSGASLPKFEEKINQKKDQYFASLLQARPNVDPHLFVQPLKDIAFSKTYEGDEFTPRSKSMLITFLVISIVIIGMAWCNYLGLWLARFSRREKELATRKVNGAAPKDFVIQFVIESILINGLSVVLAATILQLLKEPLQMSFNIQMEGLWYPSTQSVLIFPLIVIFSIGLTGVYPAKIAISKHPTASFQRAKTTGSKRTRSSLLPIAQYTSAIVIMVWAMVVYMQLNHVLDADLGFNRENIVVIEAPTRKDADFVSKMDALSNQLIRHQTISAVTYSKFMPGDYIGSGKQMRRIGSTQAVGFDYNAVDENFIPFYGLRLAAGRNFVKDDRGNAVLISRAAAQRLGFPSPESAIGSTLQADENFQQRSWTQVEIIGVFEDYRIISLFESEGNRTEYQNDQQSRGILLTYGNHTFPDFLPEKIALTIDPKNSGAAMAWARKEFELIFPGDIFRWNFLDENINRVYQNETLVRNQILLFVGLAVLVALIGFLGMIMHAAISRTKEIGIRKILGARPLHVGRLILQSSMRRFLAALVLGIPISIYLGETYMEKFSVRVILHWWHYAIPVVLFGFIMLGSVATIIWKAAIQNPVDTLKYE